MDNETIYNVVGNTDNPVMNGASDKENAFIVESGNTTINNYDSWEKIKVSGTIQNWVVDNNDFVVNTDNGSVRVSDARGKMMEFYNGNDEFIMHVCLQVPGATFNGDGEDYLYYNEETEEYETHNYGRYHEPLVVVGSSKGANTAIAGDGGSILWGGAGKTDDLLVGGDGVDVFIYDYGQGSDAVISDEEDSIVMNNTSVDDIKGYAVESNSVRFVFNDFGSLSVYGRANQFIIGGDTYTCDYDNAKVLVKSTTEE